MIIYSFILSLQKVLQSGVISVFKKISSNQSELNYLSSQNYSTHINLFSQQSNKNSFKQLMGLNFLFLQQCSLRIFTLSNKKYCYFDSFSSINHHIINLRIIVEKIKLKYLITVMQERIKVTYGLKNASAFLQKLKKEKQCEHNFSNDTVNEKQQTFDECEIPSSRQSPQQKNNEKENYENVEGGKIQNQIQKGNQISKVGLADMIIRQHLKNTLKIYNSDLDQLQQNRDNLLLAIQQLCGKLKAMTDQQNKNQIMQLQNFKKKKEIQFLLKQYHELKLHLQKRKLQLTESFIKKKQKVKSLIDLFQIDSQYIVQMESWKFYYHCLLQNKSKKNQMPDQQKVIDLVCPKAQQNVTQNGKKKQKPKVVDKSGLLGDLKNFAKNFKIPNN